MMFINVCSSARFGRDAGLERRAQMRGLVFAEIVLRCHNNQGWLRHEWEKRKVEGDEAEIVTREEWRCVVGQPDFAAAQDTPPISSFAEVGVYERFGVPFCAQGRRRKPERERVASQVVRKMESVLAFLFTTQIPTGSGCRMRGRSWPDSVIEVSAREERQTRERCV